MILNIQHYFDFNLSPEQLALAEHIQDGPVFLEGPAGSGKTTAALVRLSRLIDTGVPASEIMLLIPQRTLAQPYLRLIRHPDFPPGRVLEIFTLGSLTRRMVQLFWPLVCLPAGFAHPDQPPTFLNLESAQYYMAHLVQPLLEEGLFSSVHIDRNRLYSQIIDNVNKSALVGFPLDQLASRLKDAWVGEPAQLRIYEDVQACASLFRTFCLSHNLVDYSLQIELFTRYLWRLPLSRAYLRRSFNHLVYDNLEEDVPVAHEIITEWLPDFESACLIFDNDGGLRVFLGADPQVGYALKHLCPEQRAFHHSWINTPPLADLERQLANILPSSRHRAGDLLRPTTSAPESSGQSTREDFNIPQPVVISSDFRLALNFSFHRFFPQMLDWVADEIAALVTQGMPASEIVILAPYLSDALRFSLSNRLQTRGVATRSHRPSRALRDEPATGCLLTVAALVYPEWDFHPSRYDVVKCLMQAIDGLDLVRGQLLADIVYRERANPPEFTSFERIKPDVRDRIGYLLGERFERLRIWLEASRSQPDELDIFLSRLFGEILSQPGFGFHHSHDAGRASAALIDSVRGFRQAIGPVLAQEGLPLGREYLQMVRDGVLAAQNIHGWQVETPGAVLLAPAYTFLMSNRGVDVQFWLDIGSRGWAERVYQPLTQPYVLSRQWTPGRAWNDADEVFIQEQLISRLVLGLLRRCRKSVYLGLSDLSEGGYEQRGPLLRIFNRLLTQ